jgi:hypothetical protein
MNAMSTIEKLARRACVAKSRAAAHFIVAAARRHCHGTAGGQTTSPAAGRAVRMLRAERMA